MPKFELSLSTDYVPNWTLVDAVREFFQNALDQQITQEDNEMFFHYDGVHMLQIGNKSSVLSASTLLLGTSSKRNDKATIGQFGEGYKVATLVALREGKKVIFYNYGKKETWKPRMVKSRRYEGAEILTFFTDKFIWNRPPNNNLTIVVDGITPEEWEEIVESNLHCQQDLGDVIQTPKGRILLEDKYAGRVYVNGLFICDYDYTYGYDFIPECVKLDRDRKLVSDFDLKWLASQMWAVSGSDKIVSLALNGAKDVAYLAHQQIDSRPVEIVDQAYFTFKREYGNKAIPVTTQDEVTSLRSKSPTSMPVIVPESYQHLIKSSSDYHDPEEEELEEELRPMGKLMQWFESIEQHLNTTEIDQFHQIFHEIEEDR